MITLDLTELRWCIYPILRRFTSNGEITGNIRNGTWTSRSLQRELNVSMMTSWKMETFSALLAICAGNSRSPVKSPHKGQWRGTLMFSLICVWKNVWVNTWDAGDLRRHRTHYDVTVMSIEKCVGSSAVEATVKFQSDCIPQKTFLVASRFREICG